MTDDLSAPLPDLDWPDQAVITVDAGDPNAVITSLVIHLSQDVPEDVVKIALIPPVLAHEA